MVEWKKNDAALIAWGLSCVVKRVLFITDDGRPVVMIAGDYQTPKPSDPAWSKIGCYKWTLFGWRVI